MFAALKALLRETPEGEPAAFQSAFGGLWIDRDDAAILLRKRIARWKISRELGAVIAGFMADGFAILPGAVAPDLIDSLCATIDNGYAQGDVRLRYHTDGVVNHVLTPGTDPRGKRIIESHGVLADVRAALASPRLIAFLKAIFEDQPVLTQSLIFQTGSEQAIHQDPAFVVYDRPLHMAAAWIALEDIQEGSGELQYIPGSHRLPDYLFSTGRRDSLGAAPEEVAQFSTWVLAESDRRGLERRRFRAKKGDVLIWHAGLAHGGSPITNPHVTRRSLVGHFCPQTVFPASSSARVRRRDGQLLWSNHLYDLTLPGTPVGGSATAA